MSESRTRRLAKPMLAGAALIWGSSFFMMKDIADVIPPPRRAGPDGLPHRYVYYGGPALSERGTGLVLGFAVIFLAAVCSETKFAFFRRERVKKEEV